MSDELRELTDALHWAYVGSDVISHIVGMRYAHVSRAHGEEQIKRLFHPEWSYAGESLRWRPMLLTDKAERQWYEMQGRVRGGWFLLLCSRDLKRMKRVARTAVMKTDNPHRQATIVQRKFYGKALWKESAV